MESNPLKYVSLKNFLDSWIFSDNDSWGWRSVLYGVNTFLCKKKKLNGCITREYRVQKCWVDRVRSIWMSTVLDMFSLPDWLEAFVWKLSFLEAMFYNVIQTLMLWFFWIFFSLFLQKFRKKYDQVSFKMVQWSAIKLPCFTNVLNWSQIVIID